LPEAFVLKPETPRIGLRIGMGYDIHRAVPGKGLRLGGVAFPAAGFRLEGHSDADVIIHAACDALLGAAGLRDIGVLFPNTSNRHRDRDSLEFLAEVRRHLDKNNFGIVNLDCTLLAEAPKIAGRVPLMCQRMARALGISASDISVKATTNEHLGAIGRGEGLAAMAVTLLQRLDTALPARK
jgi:2-C-methyl-D-erythritol 2,4-cyclodiphosphate synthase